MLCTICILIVRHFLPVEIEEDESLPITQTLRFRGEDEYKECCWLHERLLSGLKKHYPMLLRRQPAFDVLFDFKRSNATEARRGNAVWFLELTLSAKPKDLDGLPWIHCKVQCSPIGSKKRNVLQQPCPWDVECPSAGRNELRTKRIKMWQSECIANHPRCNPDSRRPIWNPTRLLQLGEQGDIKLVQPQQGAPLHYIALSYRWSADPKLTLRWENLESFKQSIPISQVPITFIQCFNLAKQLGYRYIWVDSLCIVQGPDLSDWKQESLQMHNVYDHADLTIALTGLQDGEGSIRHPRCVKYAESTCLDDRWVLHEPWDDVWDEVVISAPLSSRGWALQERLLSRRIVHLGGKQMAWECRMSEALETKPVLSTTPRNDGVAGFWEAVRSGDKSEYWCNLIKEYTQRELTIPNDILRAIDGIASTLKSGDGVEYLAGMWRQTIARELPWIREPHARFRYHPSPGESLAPSWSWASVRGPIEYPSSTHAVAPKLGLSIGDMSYIPLVEVIAALPESSTASLKDQLDEPTIIRTVVLEGWTCPLGFSEVNQDGTLENVSLRSACIDQQVFKVFGVLDTHIPRPALWGLGRNEKAIFVPTIRTRTDLFGIILTTITDDPPVHMRIGSLKLQAWSNSGSMQVNSSQDELTQPSPALARLLAVCTETEAFDSFKGRWVTLPQSKCPITIQ